MAGAWFDNAYPYLVFKKEAGQYFKVAEVAGSSSTTVFNNGKWFGGVPFAAPVANLFQLDADFQPVNQTSLEIADSNYAALLSDSTLVYATASGFSSYLFDEDNSTWSAGPTLDADCDHSAYPQKSIWISDNLIICHNGTFHTFIFTRQSDKSWLQTDSFLFNTSLIYGDNQYYLYSNDEDTVVFAFPNAQPTGSQVQGYLVIYTKVNDEWVLQVVTGEEFGFSTTRSPYLGTRSFAVIDRDTLLVGAPYAVPAATNKRGGPDITEPMGLPVILQRQSNAWTPIARLSSPEVGLLGVAVGVSDTDLIVTFGPKIDCCTYSIRFFTLPRSALVPPVAAPTIPTAAPTDVVVPSTPPMGTKTPTPNSVSDASMLVGFSVSALILLGLC